MIGHVDISESRDAVSATTVVAAPAAVIFDYLRRPANHPEISGDGTVRGTNGGDERLELGSRFGMRMKLGVPYRVQSKVVELEEGRLIAWAHLGGHRWRWTFEPLPVGTTQVTETFDLSTSKFPSVLRLAGFPGRHRDNVETSVRNVAARFVAM